MNCSFKGAGIDLLYLGVLMGLIQLLELSLARFGKGQVGLAYIYTFFVCLGASVAQDTYSIAFQVITFLSKM